MIGIPYAFNYRDKNGKPYEECPVCKKHIYQEERKDFESFTGIEYQNHYAQEHSK